MTIGIDLRPVNTGEKSGVEEYTANLLRHLFFLDQKNQYKIFMSSAGKPRLNLDKLNRFKNVKVKYFPYPNKILNFGLVFLKYPKIDKVLNGVDIFFSPNIIFTSLSVSCRQIITFHDLSFHWHPEFFSLKRRIWHHFVSPKIKAQKADGIIAVSCSTRNDLVRLYNLEERKIKVIYSGVLKKFKPRDRENSVVVKVQKKYNLDPPFILYLGTIEPRKNLVGLILAFNKLKQKGYSCYKLVIAGKPGWLYQDVYKLASKCQARRDIIFTGFIKDQDKPYLYNLAEVFVYPSFYEGFGFPPLEAMASGVPVVTSNISSLPEVVGEGGLLVDPYNINEVTTALELLLADSSLREYFQKKGLAQARKFNWQKTARQTLNFFEQIYERN